MNQKSQINKDDQIIVTGRIETNSVDGEVIKFPLRLGPFYMMFIVNVPSEGETEAPVYVKFRLSFGEKTVKPEVRLARPKRSNRPQVSEPDRFPAY